MADELPQWDIEIKEIPVEGDKVSVCGIDFVFGNWSPEENYTTPYNVQIENTVGRCCANLVAAINGADSKFGGGHLNRYISSVKASYLGRFAHIQMRNLTDNGSGVEVTASAGDRITVTAYEGNIPGGGGGGGGDEAVLVKKTVTENGTYNASEDSADGYHQVTVNVVPVLGTKEINTNGTYNASSDSLQGFSSVTVNVAPNVTTKSISENGTYNASSDSVDGYSKVVVSVPPPTLVEKSVITNGVYIASSDSADGYSKVTVAVPDPVLIKDKIVRTNSEIVASSDSADGFANVIIRAKSARLVPYRFDFGTGYVQLNVALSGTGFIREDNLNLKNDVYKVKAQRRYTIYFDSAHGSRGRVMFTSANPLVVTGNITKDVEEYNVVSIGDAGGNWGNALNTIPSVDGYLIIQKSNTGQSGLQTYVIDKDFYSDPIVDENPVLIIKPTTTSITFGEVSATDGALDTSIAFSVLDESGTETTDVTAPVSESTDYSTYFRSYLKDTCLAAVLYAEGSSSPVSTGIVPAGHYTVKLVALGVSDLSKIAPNIIFRDGQLVVV